MIDGDIDRLIDIDIYSTIDVAIGCKQDVSMARLLDRRWHK